MKTYKKEVASNEKVEMIHVSLDQSENAALSWASKESMPWPTVMKGDTDQNVLIKPYKVTGVPTYLLVDREGKELARGKSAVFAKIK